MNTELNNYIYGIAEFNDCRFCKKFGANNSCPLKHAYEGYGDDKEPSSDYIQKNMELCKAHVIESLRHLL